MRIKQVLKISFCSLIFYSGLMGIYLRYFFLKRKEYPAVVINYHSFRKRGTKTLKTGPTVSMRVDEFYAHLKFLKRHFFVTTLDDIIKVLKNGKSFERPAVAITVDDGFKDNYDFLFPILKKCDIPATIFLTAGFIGTDRKIWIEKLLHLFTNSHVKEFVFEELCPAVKFEMQSWRGKRRAYRCFVDRLKEVSPEKRDACIRKISQRLGNPGDSAATMLDWDQVREMASAGIDFGAHTMTHPILTQIPMEDAKKEIFESKKIIERELNRPVRHFAYPNGRQQDFNPDLVQFCRQIRFESISTCCYGSNQAAKDVWALKRIGSETPLASFAVDLLRLFVK